MTPLISRLKRAVELPDVRNYGGHLQLGMRKENARLAPIIEALIECAAHLKCRLIPHSDGSKCLCDICQLLAKLEKLVGE